MVSTTWVARLCRKAERAALAAEEAAKGKLLWSVTLSDDSVRFSFDQASIPSEAAAIPVGASPEGIDAADFNGDGLADIAVAVLGTNTVDVLLRNPGGGFTAEAPIPVGAGALGLATADFNADGRPDLAVTSNTAGTATVLLRQATGGFAADGAPLAAPGANGVAAGDFNAWNPERSPFFQRDEDQWFCVLHLPPGSFGYLLAVETDSGWYWQVDESNPERTRDFLGRELSLLVVEQSTGGASEE